MRRRSNDRGVGAVELALITPILALLLFGTIDAGVMYAQSLDVQHAAREAARVAAVNDVEDDSLNNQQQAAAYAADVCTRLSLEPGTTVQFQRSSGAGGGDFASTTVSSPRKSVTGFLDMVFPVSVDSSLDFRLEASPVWAPSTHTC